jgi:beta-lactamase regulating signal transducer with metallopeptidase domain
MMNQHFLELLTTQIWQIAALAIFVAVIVRLFAKNRPHLAHALWILVLIKCVTPPFWGHSLGVFSQLQLQLTSDESSAVVTDTKKNTVPVDAPAIAFSAPHVDTSSAGDQSLEFPAHDELVAELETESPAEIASTGYSDNVMEHDEAPSAITAAVVNASGFTTDDPRYSSTLVITICTGAILTLLIMMLRCFHCVRLIHQHRASEFDEPLRDRIQQLAKQLGIRRIPQIIVSDVLFGPAVFGLLRHTIALPRCLFKSTEGEPTQAATSAECQAVAVETASSGRVVADCNISPGTQDLQFLDPILAHELIHIRRGDLLTGTLQVIVQSLWWFHPAVWFLNRWLSREAERCCDEEVIAELGCTPGQYARSLLRVIECKHRLQPIPVFPGMKPVEITSQRMERIMSLNNGLTKRTPIWCWLLVLALAFVVLPGAIAKPAPDEDLLLQVRMRDDVSLSFSNTSLTDVLRSIAIDQGINIAVKTSAEDIMHATVTHHCENEPLDEALNTILEPLGLFARLHRNIVMIESANAKKAPAVAVPRLMRVYAVADLVAYKNPVGVAVSETGDSGDGAAQHLPPAVAVAHARENSSDQSEADPTLLRESSTAVSTDLKPDFAPLTELIKATVQPETWEPLGSARIAVDQESLGLVILQTPSAHDEIQALLSQFRNDTDQSVRIQCRIVELTKDSQTAWLENQCSLFPLEQGSQWALLPQQRSEAFAQGLLEQQPEVLSVPTVMTISGQTATISVGQSTSNDTAPTGIRLELTPHLLPESKVIRLQHSFSIGAFDRVMLMPTESLVGSGQMLLLLVDAPEDKENAVGEKSHYLLMLTPQHLPETEMK